MEARSRTNALSYPSVQDPGIELLIAKTHHEEALKGEGEAYLIASLGRKETV